MKLAMLDMQMHDIFCIYLLEPPGTVPWAPPICGCWNITCLNKNNCDCTIETKNLYGYKIIMFPKKNIIFFNVWIKLYLYKSLMAPLELDA